MELGREFQGTAVAESNSEDHPVHVIRVLVVEAADQLGLELGRKFQGAKLSNTPKGRCSSDKVSEREDFPKGEGDESGIRVREDSKELPKEKRELLHQLRRCDEKLPTQ